MEFNPIPFFISFVIISSVFHLVYMEYIKLKRETYNLWVQAVCYEDIPEGEDDKKAICARAEALRRETCQTNDLCVFIVLLAFFNVLIYKLYYRDYVSYPNNVLSNLLILDRWISIMMIVIFVFFIFEYLYLRVGIKRDIKTGRIIWPILRKHEKTEDRLRDVWLLMSCREIKVPRFDDNKKPRDFYQE